MFNDSLHIIDTNISHAWALAFQALMKPGVKELVPLTVNITFAPGQAIENPLIRQKLDQALKERGRSVCDTVASTIFPQSLWAQGQNRTALFKRYLDILPLLRKYPANRNGLYFERLIAYKPKGDGQTINQLDLILAMFERDIRRRSALQAAIFDPTRDHVAQKQRGFPCLQHVNFVRFGRQGQEKLAVEGLYATQHIFEKAYGNYLGLYRLGRFVAHELHLDLARVTCVATLGVLGKAGKEELRELSADIETVLEDDTHNQVLMQTVAVA